MEVCYGEMRFGICIGGVSHLYSTKEHAYIQVMVVYIYTLDCEIGRPAGMDQILKMRD